MEGIIDLHHDIMFFIVAIITFALYLLKSVATTNDAGIPIAIALPKNIYKGIIDSFTDWVILKRPLSFEVHNNYLETI
jgi:hypothetical protein